MARKTLDFEPGKKAWWIITSRELKKLYMELNMENQFLWFKSWWWIATRSWKVFLWNDKVWIRPPDDVPLYPGDGQETMASKSSKSSMLSNGWALLFGLGRFNNKSQQNVPLRSAGPESCAEFNQAFFCQSSTSWFQVKLKWVFWAMCRYHGWAKLSTLLALSFLALLILFCVALTPRSWLAVAQAKNQLSHTMLLLMIGRRCDSRPVILHSEWRQFSQS